MLHQQEISHQRVLTFLEAIRRRLWRRTFVDQVLFAVCLLIFLFIVWQLLRDVLASAGYAATVLPAALIILTMGWRASRETMLTRAAREADQCAQLDDELTSAYFFLQDETHSLWTLALIERAAVTAGRLDVRRIVPVRRPQHWVPALALTAVAVVTPWIPHENGMAFESPLAGKVIEEGRAKSGNEANDALVQDLISRQDRGTSDADKERSLERGGGFIDQANLELLATRDALQQLASAMRGNQSGEAANQGTQDGRASEALQQLKKLASEFEQRAEDKTVDTDEAGRDATTGIRPELPDQAALDAARDITRMATKVNQETLDRTLKSLEQTTDQMNANPSAGTTTRKADNTMFATRQESEIWANRYGQGARMPPNMNAQGSPATGNATLKGGIMFRMGAVAKGDKEDQASEGSKAGSAAGHSQALAVEGLLTQRLGVKLRREAIQSQRPGEGDQGNSRNDWFYAASREQKAKVSTTDVDTHNTLVGENVAGSDGVPMKYRGLVKGYFTAVHEEKAQPP